MARQTLSIEPLAASLGAEVRGVDLGQPLDDATRKELHDAWMQHQVLFFRDQDITVEQHKAFARNFGALHIHPVLQPLKDEGHPEIVLLESDAKRPFVAAGWHSDVTFEQEPPLGSILRAVAVPEAGGDTMWSSMYAAYDALSSTMQRLLSELRAVHDAKFFDGIADKKAKQELDSRPETVHPVIRTHPVTGRKGIFVNMAFTRRIKGMRPTESDTLLRFLFDHVGSPNFTCRFRWRKNSIAMWDNRCTQHRVVADNLSAYRRMERITLIGDRPY